MLSGKASRTESGAEARKIMIQMMIQVMVALHDGYVAYLPSPLENTSTYLKSVAGDGSPLLLCALTPEDPYKTCPLLLRFNSGRIPFEIFSAECVALQLLKSTLRAKSEPDVS